MRIGVAERRQADEIERRIDPLPLALQDALRLQPERDIVPDRTPGKQGRVLKHDHARGMRSPDAVVVFPQDAGSGFLQPRHQPQQGGLAAAGWSQKCYEFAGLDDQIHVFEHRERGAIDIEGMADMFDIERSAGSGNR